MSAKKQWTGQEKLSIVLQGLRGECSVSALCNEHGITQGMYYKWRDLLLAEGAKIFARGGIDHEKERLQHENRKLKETIGELAIELKKRVVMRRKRTMKANAKLLMRIQELKSEHSYWGYRRIWAYLKFHQKFPVNRKRIYRLMKDNNLLVPKNKRLRTPRKAETHKPRPKEPNRFWGIDMTKVMIPSFGWVYLHVVLDWGTKKLLSVHLSLTSKAADWIYALNEAVNLQFPDGIRKAASIPYIVSDHGCQPTSTSFFKACSELGIEQIFASYSNPKGNADTERVIRTIKEDLVWTKEFDSVASFEAALKGWQKAYNEEYPHSSLAYMTPYEYERWFNASAA